MSYTPVVEAPEEMELEEFINILRAKVIMFGGMTINARYRGIDFHFNKPEDVYWAYACAMRAKNADFLADKLTEIAREELESGAEQGRLHYFSKDSIDSLIKIIELYYRICEREHGGGIIFGDINAIIQHAFQEYFFYKKEGLDRAAKANPQAIEFINGVDKLVFKNENGEVVSLDELKKISMDEGIQVVEMPKYKMSEIGNGGSFSVIYTDENGERIKCKYVDNGIVLDEPIISSAKHI